MAYSVLHNRCGCGVILKHPIKVCDKCHMARALKAIVANPRSPTVDYLTTSEALAAMRANPGTKYYNHVDGEKSPYHIMPLTGELRVELLNGLTYPTFDSSLETWDRTHPDNQLKWYKA